MRARGRGERGLTMIEMLIAVALLGFILLGILPLFIGSVKSNFSANEYTSIHNLSRDRLEQLMNLPFVDAQLVPGVHFPTGATRTDDLPPILPDPATGVPPTTGGVVNPFTLSYQVMQWQIPDAATVPNGLTCVPQPLCGSFVPIRVTVANLAYQYKRIDVTVLSSTGPLGIGARVAKVSGVIMNPSPATNLSVVDPGP
jgi:prepilin-type N-terminal cleavage/methylation domain-containing protein